MWKMRLGNGGIIAYPCHKDMRTRSNPSLLCLLLLSLLTWSFSAPREMPLRFEIIRGGGVIGEVRAQRQETSDRIRYHVTSHAVFRVLLEQQVRTTMDAVYLEGRLASCHATLRVNESLRDSSLMRTSAERCFVHPSTTFTCQRNTEWTTARMYFEEPVGQDRIFVESLLKEAELSHTGPGTYLLRFPDGKENRYVYRDGLLREVHARRPLVDLVFRRL